MGGARVFVSPRGLAINTMRGSSYGRNRCGGRDDIGGDASLHRARGERPGRARSNRHRRAAEAIVPSARRGDDAARSVWRATLTSNFTFLSATVGFKCFRDAPADLARPVGSSAPAWCPPPRCPVNNGALRRTL